jgi:hypothetical protein
MQPRVAAFRATLNLINRLYEAHNPRHVFHRPIS